LESWQLWVRKKGTSEEHHKEAKKHAPKMDARALKNRKSVSTLSSDFIN
jgi:hypothetical protein